MLGVRALPRMPRQARGQPQPATQKRHRGGGGGGGGAPGRPAHLRCQLLLLRMPARLLPRLPRQRPQRRAVAPARPALRALAHLPQPGMLGRTPEIPCNRGGDLCGRESGARPDPCQVFWRVTQVAASCTPLTPLPGPEASRHLTSQLKLNPARARLAARSLQRGQQLPCGSNVQAGQAAASRIRVGRLQAARRRRPQPQPHQVRKRSGSCIGRRAVAPAQALQGLHRVRPKTDHPSQGPHAGSVVP